MNTVIAVLFLAFASVQVFADIDTSRKSRIVKGAYIIEFKSTFTRRFKINQFSEFYRGVASTQTAIRTRLNLTSRFFNGASFFINDEQSLAAIRALDFVQKIWPISTIPRPKAEINMVLNAFDGRGRVLCGDGLEYYPPHTMTGVDKLHKMGYYGQNVTVAIVDTGIDYKHPDLGGGFGPGYKVSFGYDFVGDAYDGYNTPVPDDDPFTECDGHGTHVAGTIGAQGSLFVGVAPNATLAMYRVFGCTGFVSDDVLIQAYLMAEQSGAHIITASIGGPSGWPDQPWSLVVDRIAKSGITCLVAAGNEGTSGLFYGSTAAGATAAIGVASINAIEVPLLKFRARYKIRNRRKKLFSYFASSRDFDMSVSNYSVISIDPLMINHIDACTPFANGTPSFSSKILLIKYGSCDWETQYTNLANVEADNVMFFDNSNFAFLSQRTKTLISYGIVRKPLVNLWSRALRKRKSIRIYFSPKFVSMVSYEPSPERGGKISNFTTWYPMNDLSFKPDITAPGGYIFSTVPIAIGGYAVYSGTSMATPYAAGVAALYLSAKGLDENTSAADLKNILLNTATPLNYAYNYKNYSYLAPTCQQGLGLINAAAVLESKTRLNVSTISLNDTQNFKNTTTFTISNSDSTNVTYTLMHVGAGTFHTFNILPDDLLGFASVENLTENYATVTFSPSSVDVGPGQSVTITAEFSPPFGLTPELLGIYSGFIRIVGTNEETQHIGYIGAVGSMKDLNLNGNLIQNTKFTYSNGNVTSIPMQSNQIVDFNTSKLSIETSFTMGTALWRIDVLGTGANHSVAGVSVAATVIGFPIYWESRTTESILALNAWDGTLSSNQTLQSGNYSLLLRVLKIFGDRENPDDYYTCESPNFLIV